MGGVVLGSKKYYYKTKELAQEAMIKAMKEQVSVSEVPSENAIFVGLPSEPINSAAAKALRDNCVRVDEFQEIHSTSEPSAIFEDDLPLVSLIEKDWVTIEKDSGMGLKRVTKSNP